jgi:hypothetical protein
VLPVVATVRVAGRVTGRGDCLCYRRGDCCWCLCVAGCGDSCCSARSDLVFYYARGRFERSFQINYPRSFTFHIRHSGRSCLVIGPPVDFVEIQFISTLLPLITYSPICTAAGLACMIFRIHGGICSHDPQVSMGNLWVCNASDCDRGGMAPIAHKRAR